MAGVYTVTQINSYIKNMFAQDYLLGRLSVKGEVSNCKYHSAGHIYFTLKDEGAAINCIMFAGNRKGLTFRLTNGQQVIVSGSAGVYEKGGSYQIYVNAIRQEGIGELYERYEALKEKLQEMGMFDGAYKQPVPRYVRTLGVVTAPTGAAVRDIIQIATRRNPGIRILLYPAKVQGEGAAESIVLGIRALAQAGVDVIIVGRGGGSIEDLWAFNEESVARAIFACDVPVISAVGHETDVVISDFVADLRAPTPSAAAELAVADMCQLAMRLDTCREQLQNEMMRSISGAKRNRDLLAKMLAAYAPENRTRQVRAQLETKAGLLQRCVLQILERSRGRARLYQEQLENASPYGKLEQGYAFVTKEDGTRVRQAADAAAGDRLLMRFADGTLTAVVENTDGR